MNLSEKLYRKHRQIQKLVVDCGNKYDISTHHELLNQQEALESFGNCKKGNLKGLLI